MAVVVHATMAPSSSDVLNALSKAIGLIGIVTSLGQISSPASAVLVVLKEARQGRATGSRNSSASRRARATGSRSFSSSCRSCVQHRKYLVLNRVLRC